MNFLSDPITFHWQLVGESIAWPGDYPNLQSP